MMYDSSYFDHFDVLLNPFVKGAVWRCPANGKGEPQVSRPGTVGVRGKSFHDEILDSLRQLISKTDPVTSREEAGLLQIIHDENVSEEECLGARARLMDAGLEPLYYQLRKYCVDLGMRAELVNAGLCALYCSTLNCNLNKASFATYVEKPLRTALTRTFRKFDAGLHLSERVENGLWKLKEARSKLQCQGKDWFEDGELLSEVNRSHKKGMSEKEFRRLLYDEQIRQVDFFQYDKDGEILEEKTCSRSCETPSMNVSLDDLIREERWETYLKAREQMTEFDRNLIDMHYFNGMSYAAIAREKIWGTTDKKVKASVERAVEHIRQIIETMAQ